jgi:NAD(P)H-dependent FMN reductase
VWSATIAAYHRFVFVTPEYNHSTSGALKNAIDYLYREWNNKVAAFVSYGSAGGVRAIEHLRAVASELQIAHVRQALRLSFWLYSDFAHMTVFKPGAEHSTAAETMFAQLESWTRAMRSIRSSTGDIVSGHTDEEPIPVRR